MTHVKKLYRKNKDGKYVFLGHVPDTYPLDENEKFEDAVVESNLSLVDHSKRGLNSIGLAT